MTNAPARRGRGYFGLILPFAAVLLALIAWTVWWFVVANGVETQTDRSAAELRQAGYAVSWRERSVTGWPFRTFVQFEDFRLAGPTGVGITSPEIGAEANTYALGKWVIAAPKGMAILRGSKGAVQVDGLALRASISDLDQTPANIVVELRQPVFTPLAGAEPFPLSKAETVDFYLRPKDKAVGDGEFLVRIVGGHARPGGVFDQLSGGKAFLARWQGTLTHVDHLQGKGWSQAIAHWSRDDGAITDSRAEVTADSATAEATSARLVFGADGRMTGAANLDLKGGPAAAIKNISALREALTGASAAATAAPAATAQPAAAPEAKVKLVFDADGTHLDGLRIAPAPKLF
jgi:hypothetical protein